jgi:hypothetical protein
LGGFSPFGRLLKVDGDFLTKKFAQKMAIFGRILGL